jgi:ComF family protein
MVSSRYYNVFEWLRRQLLNSGQRLVHWLAPALCWSCRSLMEACFQRDVGYKALCDACSLLLRPFLAADLRISGSITLPVFAVGAYVEPLRSLILAKNSGSVLAARQLGLLMVEKTPLRSRPCDLLVPIPLHWWRRVKRGFNQAEVMAQVIGAAIHKPVVRAIKRVKNTQLQSSLTALGRADNVLNAFALAIDPTALQGKQIVLVDDLMTTGATLAAAARVLITQEPASLSVIVACRAVQECSVALGE